MADESDNSISDELYRMVARSLLAAQAADPEVEDDAEVRRVAGGAEVAVYIYVADDLIQDLDAD
jgi:hypothetical protein